jgi:ribosomal protein L11 methyltransferase
MSHYTFRTAAPYGLEGAEAAILWEHGCQGISEEDGALVAYFEAPVPLPLEGTWSEPDETDYLAVYYEGLQAVTAGTLHVAPTHAGVTLAAGEKVLWLDPGMAFGSGHHETTFSVLEDLGKLDLEGAHVLDVGAGSGVLAIAADLLGAESATGIDNDPDTIPIARENARLNRSRAKFAFATLDVAELPARPDVIVANLYADLHCRLLADYRARLAPQGTLILSGILQLQAGLVLECSEGVFEVRERRDLGEWVTLVLTPAGAASESGA